MKLAAANQDAVPSVQAWCSGEAFSDQLIVTLWTTRPIMVGERWVGMLVRYSDDVSGVRERMLAGFFVGWPQPPSSGQHLAVLRGSFRAVVAIDDEADRVVGFVTMISDGVLTASIPWLEVLAAYQGQGIGTELMRRILAGTERFYSVDLLCDASLQAYYARHGMTAASGATLRHRAALRG